MKIIKKAENGVEYLFGLLKQKSQTITRAVLWKIPHKSDVNDLRLKIGRYKKIGFEPETLECSSPKSELTLDNEEFKELLVFLSENYQPFCDGAKKYIPIENGFDPKDLEHIKAIFKNPDKEKLLNFIAENNILPEDLIHGLQHQTRKKAIAEFEKMLSDDLSEKVWQDWFKDNSWVLGTDFVKILDERHIDTSNISDYLMQAYDGFLDIIEIKKPETNLKFWSTSKDHDNYIPSSDLTKAITQATKYIYEVERESNSLKFTERVGIKTIKPRCVLIFGRSSDWDNEQKEAYRILNSNYHNLTILTYDHVLDRAKRILDYKPDAPENPQIIGELPEELFEEEVDARNIPF
ncbi:MAG: Shedu immune nuclease family protein [Patescibacteria group bacterium]